MHPIKSVTQTQPSKSASQASPKKLPTCLMSTSVFSSWVRLSPTESGWVRDFAPSQKCGHIDLRFAAAAKMSWPTIIGWYCMSRTHKPTFRKIPKLSNNVRYVLYMVLVCFWFGVYPNSCFSKNVFPSFGLRVPYGNPPRTAPPAG